MYALYILLSYLNDCSSEYFAISMSVDDVSNGLKLVKLGKSCGVDGLSAEHFIYAGKYVKVYLSILYTSFISHMVILTRWFYEVGNYSPY